ncbi:hypothetical protein H0E87_023979 [Populus deltoides]|uniref:Uncharacterized protein n=1 Tax=Populus deltoides TaxID=3696 RepID=A0A8T2X4E7_POPDE|nr:hypothetical protein H0E87_023979 [Populus deltoides]
MDTVLQGLLGRVVRQCYAVLCLGAILVSVAIAHSTRDVKPNDHRERTTRRLTAMQEIGEVRKIMGGNCSPSPQRSFAPGFACVSVLLLCFFLSTQQELKKKTFY